MKKYVNVMVLLVIIMCTNFISCNSNPNQETNAFDLSHAKKVNVSIEEMNPKIEPLNIYDDTESYHNGLKSFKEKGLYGFVDQDNNVAIAPKYKYVQEFYNKNRAIVSTDGIKYGVINRMGTYVIMPQFDDIMALTLNLYRVESDGEVGIIDSIGAIVVKNGKYDDIDYDGFCGFVKVSKENKWGFVDINGMEIVNPQYDEINLPLDSEGFAAVKINNNWGLIDLNGNVIIPFEHKLASSTGKGEDQPALIYPYEGKYDREIVYFEIYKNGTVIAKTIPENLLK